MNRYILIMLLLFSPFCDACTGFGVITKDGTLIGRSRDYYYNPQKFELMLPIQQFNNWYENNYHHNNEFYALTSQNNVSMGVNQNGLTIVEENSPLPKNYKENRRFQQPENGTAEGMIKYGILQNFNTVDEIIPFLPKIFSVADPQFYQIADAKKILTVEVAYGDNNADLTRKFTYKIISKKGDYFAHTNVYLNPEYTPLNSFNSDPDSLNGAKNRLQKITNFLATAKVINMDVAASWLRDTSSNVVSSKNKNACLESSLFRSDLRGLNYADLSKENDKIFGTVSSMVVANNGDLKKSYIYLMMVDSVSRDSNNKQLIKYKELRTSLANLFKGSEPIFVAREFVRSPPVNGICT